MVHDRLRYTSLKRRYYDDDGLFALVIGEQFSDYPYALTVWVMLHSNPPVTRAYITVRAFGYFPFKQALVYLHAGNMALFHAFFSVVD